MLEFLHLLKKRDVGAQFIAPSFLMRVNTNKQDVGAQFIAPSSPMRISSIASSSPRGRNELRPYILILMFLLAGCTSFRGRGRNSLRPYILILMFLLAACTSSSPAQNTPTPTLPATSMACPAAGMARVAVMTPLALGTSQAIVYIYNAGTYAQPGDSLLRRYDVASGVKTDILTPSKTYLSHGQVSADGQWVLFTSVKGGQTAIQMVRLDGKEEQTLYCTAPAQIISGLAWSPDQHLIAFSVTSAGQGTSATVGSYVLDVRSGKLQMAVDQPAVGNVSTWLGNSRVLFASNTVSLMSTKLFVLDTTKSLPQSTLQELATQPPCGDYVPAGDGSQLLLSQCTQGSGGKVSGPSKLIALPLTGGDTGNAGQTVYNSSTLAITAVRMLSPTTALLIVGNRAGDTRNNGLWEMQTDGSHMLRLTGDDSFVGFNSLGGRTPWANVSRDGNFYCFAQQYNKEKPGYTLLYVGSLDTSALKVFSTLANGQGNAEIVGWTTM